MASEKHMQQLPIHPPPAAGMLHSAWAAIGRGNRLCGGGARGRSSSAPIWTWITPPIPTTSLENIWGVLAARRGLPFGARTRGLWPDRSPLSHWPVLGTLLRIFVHDRPQCPALVFVHLVLVWHRAKFTHPRPRPAIRKPGLGRDRPNALRHHALHHGLRPRLSPASPPVVVMDVEEDFR